MFWRKPGLKIVPKGVRYLDYSTRYICLVKKELDRGEGTTDLICLRCNAVKQKRDVLRQRFTVHPIFSEAGSNRDKHVNYDLMLGMCGTRTASTITDIPMICGICVPILQLVPGEEAVVAQDFFSFPQT